MRDKYRYGVDARRPPCGGRGLKRCVRVRMLATAVAPRAGGAD